MINFRLLKSSFSNLLKRKASRDMKLLTPLAANNVASPKSTAVVPFPTNCGSGQLKISDSLHLPDLRTPWLMLPPEVDGKNKQAVDQFYNPAENELVRLNRENLGVPTSAICFASTRGWLGYVDPKGECPVYLTNPYGVKDVVQLPSLDTMPCIVGVERHPKTKEVVRFKKWDFYEFSDEIDPFYMLTPEELVREQAISHLVLSSWDPRSESCVVVSTQGGELAETRLAYCPIGNQSLKGSENDKADEIAGDIFEWKGVMQDEWSMGCFEKQVVFSDKTKLFYAFYGESIVAYDLHNKRKRSQVVFKFPNINEEAVEELAREDVEELTTLRNMCMANMGYIVPLDNGDILYIVRHYCEEVKEGADKGTDKEELEVYKTLLFDVFRVDFRNRKLEHVRSLGDRALFIGSNHSFSLSTRYKNGLHPNSIYFTDHTYLGRRYSNCEVGIYNLAKNEVLPCYPFTDGDGNVVPSSNRNKLMWVAPMALKS